MADVLKILDLLQQNTGPSRNKYDSHVFANHSEEDEIYPLTVKEIVVAQKADITLKHFFKRNAVLDKGLELSFSTS